MSQWIQTFSGVKFDLEAPTVEMVRIEDIAHALSLLCRFCGHVREPYSVARHSLYVCENLPYHLKLEGLLHDASEAYCADISNPLKALLPDYKKVEERVDLVIRQKFNLQPKESSDVKSVDRRMLVTERRDLFDQTIPWEHPNFIGVNPYLGKVTPRLWFIDERDFLKELRRLCPTYLM